MKVSGAEPEVKVSAHVGGLWGRLRVSGVKLGPLGGRY